MADITITDAGGGLGHPHYTAAENVGGVSCPAECRTVFKIAPFIVSNTARYDALYLQLNFAEIWLPWTTKDQQTIQMWQHTDPYALSRAWTDVGSVQRTVVAIPLPATLPLFATGLGVLGLLGWRRSRKQAAAVGAE